MADWGAIERVLDDQTEAHTCAFCGGGIPRGDGARWGVAARDTHDNVSVMWVHVPCFVGAVRPQLRGGLAAMTSAARHAERVVGRATVAEPGAPGAKTDDAPARHADASRAGPRRPG